MDHQLIETAKKHKTKKRLFLAGISALTIAAPLTFGGASAMAHDVDSNNWSKDHQSQCQQQTQVNSYSWQKDKDPNCDYRKEDKDNKKDNKKYEQHKSDSKRPKKSHNSKHQKDSHKKDSKRYHKSVKQAKVYSK